MRRSLIACLFTAILLVGLPVRPAIALGPGACNTATTGNYFSGQKGLNPPTYGVSATISLVYEALCTPVTGNPGHGSFSSSWVAISADDDPYDIYQIGFDTCQQSGCPSGTKWFWAYGTGDGVCDGVAPSPHWMTSPTGNHQYKIDRMWLSPQGLSYVALIDSNLKNWRAASTIETCWAPYGPRAWSFRNEVGDRGDQSGGQVSPHQTFSSLKFKKTSGWVSVNLIVGVCNPAPSLGTQKCSRDATLSDKIHTWDTRVP